MEKIAVVTGAGRGIGLYTAAALKKKGYKVFDLSRRGGSEEYGVIHIPTDVSDFEAVKSAVDRIAGECGRIDILINNAGFGISGAVEFTDLSDAKRLFDVNFFGAFNCAKAVIPYMRAQGGGTIVNLSSVAAPVPIPFQSFYSASKAAVSSFTASLANEVKAFGIQVRAVLPGDIKTDFTSARKKNDEGDDLYGGVIKRSVGQMEHDEQTGMSAEKAGNYIAKIAAKKRGRIFYTIRADYKILAFLAKRLPAKTLNAVLRLIYYR